MKKRRADPLVVLAGVLYALVVVALATVLVWPVYQTQRLVVVAAVGAGVGVVLAVVARWLRWSGWVTAPVAMLVYAVVAVPVAVPYRMTSPPDIARGVGEAFVAVVVGWRQLLTLRLPVVEYRSSLAPWLAATLVICLVGTSLAVRADRRAGFAVPVLGVLAVLAGVLAPATPGAAGLFGPVEVPDLRFTAPGAAMVAATVTWLVTRARLRRRRALATGTGTGTTRRVRRAGLAAVAPVAAGIVLCTVALVTAVVVTPAVFDAGERRTVRDGVEPVLAIAAEPSPLDQYRAAFAGSAATTELFTIKVTGAPVDRLRIAVMDEYDGQHFTTSTDGGRFLRVPRIGATGSSRTTVTIGDMATGIWMPVPDGAVGAPRFTGPRADQLAGGFYYSAWASAALEVAPSGTGTTGLRSGDSYRVASSAPRRGQLDQNSDAPMLVVADYPQMAAWVKAQGQPRSAEGFVELLDRLRSRGYLSHWLDADDAEEWAGLLDKPQYSVVPAYAGHSAVRIDDLFGQLNDQEEAVGSSAPERELVAAVGDDEQFATAAALLARFMGFESRVVLGVRLASNERGLATCDAVCLGADLAAWVEVRSPGGVWVTFDVEPQKNYPPRPVTQGEEPPANPTQVREPYLEVVPPPDDAQDSMSQSDKSADGDDGLSGWWVQVLVTVGLSLGMLLALLVPFLAVPIAKAARRRRRRRAAVPEVAAVGAWAELSDRCLDLGVPLVGPTRREAANATGRPAVGALATLVDTAVYGAVPVTAVVSDQAWAAFEQDLADVRVGMSKKDRMWAWLRPRSILHALTMSGGPGMMPATPVHERESSW
ncbi:MAG: transglutaminase-like domain-containing protein [Micrococcales bacterium]|nr:transglutaminase-like domain-containing protein [Micrococcales bacterium]